MVRLAPLPAALVALLVGLVVGATVALAVTAVLNSIIWPSLLVGLPTGLFFGGTAAYLLYRYLTRPVDDETNWRRTGTRVVVAIVVSAAIFGGLSLLGDQRRGETATSTYEYRVSLSADDDITNATFYVPVPVQAGETPIGDRFVDTVRAERYPPAVEGYDGPANPVEFTYELVETDHGPMMKLSTDRIDVTQVYYREVANETMGWHERIDESEYDPQNPQMGVQDDGSFTFSISVVANETIDTAEPIGAEPLLSAQEQTQISCTDAISDAQRCYRTDGVVYAEYESSPETTVFVGTELEGRNEWFSGGWTGNTYRQWSTVEILGPNDGWIQTDGTLEVGVGRY